MSTAETKDSLSPTKRALLELREMRAQLEALERAKSEPIAIVGVGCRFPGRVDSPESFWRLLANGVHAVSEIPPERWDMDALYDPTRTSPRKMHTRWGGVLDDVEQFDPSFFGISLGEAAYMDPQQRLVLEVTWETFEHAGIAPERAAGTRTGVFIAACIPDFYKVMAIPPPRGGTGSLMSVIANRVSYTFDLRGPSLVVDTACSSSLVAVDLAVQSLRSRASDMALAGGVNIILAPDVTISFSQAGMMAADGRCKTFDASGDGYVRSEGCGLVLLKRLSDALADGDRIVAVIRGSAVNQDGRSNGLTAPNVLAQQDVIRRALSDGRVEPSRVTCIEAHGTGTALGDPIEVAALSEVYGGPRPAGRRCVLGSLKTNMGHPESAAGIAGLIKLALSLQHKAIPPLLHFQRLNPNIALDRDRFEIPVALRPWDAGGERRIGGVSAFGVGGTNAHIILEEAPERPLPQLGPKSSQHLLLLSARSDAELRQLATRHAQHLAERPELELGDHCFTAATGRAHFAHRLAVPASTSAEARAHLEAFGAQGSGPSLHARLGERRPRLVFAFPGRSGGAAGDRVRRLYETQPIFRTAFERCEALVGPGSGRPLAAHLFSPSDAAPAYAAAAHVALQWALLELFRGWGVAPSAVFGDAEGCAAAACAAGVVELDQVLPLLVEFAGLLELGVARAQEVPASALGAAERRLSAVEQRAPSLPWLSGPRRAAESSGGPRLRVADLLSLSPSAAPPLGEGDVVLELGPRAGGAEVEQRACRWVNALCAEPEGWEAPLRALAVLYAEGAPVDWGRFDSGHPRRRVELPTYPFRRRRCWPPASDVQSYTRKDER